MTQESVLGHPFMEVYSLMRTAISGLPPERLEGPGNILGLSALSAPGKSLPLDDCFHLIRKEPQAHENQCKNGKEEAQEKRHGPKHKLDLMPS